MTPKVFAVFLVLLGILLVSAEGRRRWRQRGDRSRRRMHMSRDVQNSGSQYDDSDSTGPESRRPMQRWFQRSGGPGDHGCPHCQGHGMRRGMHGMHHGMHGMHHGMHHGTRHPRRLPTDTGRDSEISVIDAGEGQDSNTYNNRRHRPGMHHGMHHGMHRGGRMPWPFYVDRSSTASPEGQITGSPSDTDDTYGRHGRHGHRGWRPRMMHHGRSGRDYEYDYEYYDTDSDDTVSTTAKSTTTSSVQPTTVPTRILNADFLDE